MKHKETSLLIAIHGSRDDRALAQADKIRQTLAEKKDWAKVEIGWLQFIQPSVDVALERMVGGGARRIVVAPLFVLSGRHVDDDIPAIIAECSKRHPECEITMGGPLVDQKRFLDFLTEYCRDLTY